MTLEELQTQLIAAFGTNPGQADSGKFRAACQEFNASQEFVEDERYCVLPHGFSVRGIFWDVCAVSKKTHGTLAADVIDMGSRDNDRAQLCFEDLETAQDFCATMNFARKSRLRPVRGVQEKKPQPVAQGAKT